MTPAARVAAAVDVLEAINGGTAAEKALTNWARSNRFAGSGDRAAIRDLVFGVLRRRRSAAAFGGGEEARALMLGDLLQQGIDVEQIFTGARFAPPPLTADERARIASAPDLSQGEALDCPDWLLPRLVESLGEDHAPVLRMLRERSPVGLRVNLARATRQQAIEMLTAEKIGAQPHPLSPSALVLEGHPRGLPATSAFRDGMVEIQDPASQAVVDALPLEDGIRVLDYCAGGGGKTLAMAGRAKARFHVHDISAQRMKDLPERAARAGVALASISSGGEIPEGAYDLVLCDAPCSGSGAWRRSPEAKWTLTPDRLKELTTIQAGILEDASNLVGPGGTLAYATCSLLTEENDALVANFLDRHSDFEQSGRLRLTPLDGGDGFFLSVLRRL